MLQHTSLQNKLTKNIISKSTLLSAIEWAEQEPDAFNAKKHFARIKFFV